ncbi:hypothetical protein CkaCkLH20_04688 [Colletotrichum karsti]|uniref:DUF7580 domain-containing protein n=1 Tax=Colletotrichum karsti TaxID=1095194 RepID=A0A9P6I5A4_9PEZI|nr:uncharacterized protein CkaCkLH20_04688 [Colletotrichum karsti]KAF9877553.1 hypothetical protein CkaCkLH20_04688 [Colletotrichum karsti]
MVNHPTGPAWNDESIQAKIKVRLWRSYGVFETTVKDMEEATADLKQRLGFQSQSEISQKNDTLFSRGLKRVAFVLKRSDYEEQLTTIKNGITSLESLIDRNVKMEPDRRLRSQGRLITLIREISGSLYRAMKSSFQCSCAHDVHLGLTSHTTAIAQDDGDEDIIQKIAFQFALTFKSERKTQGSGKSNMQLSWEKVRVQALPQVADHNVTPTERHFKSRKTGRDGSKVVGSALPSFQEAVPPTAASNRTSRFGQTSTMVVQESLSALSVGHSSTNPNNLINMCEVIRKGQKQICFDCFGMINDRTATTYREFGVYPVLSNEYGQWSTVSLREILEQPLDYPHLSFTAKLQLAVVVSSSFLKLQQTPWLPEILTSRHILFLKNDNQLSYENAFIMKRLPENPQEDEDNMNSTSISRSPALLALGLLLLELILGCTVEALRIPQDETPGGAAGLMPGYITAQRVLRQQTIGSMNYSSAVQRCICGEFARPTLDLNDDGFRQEIYEKVVVLLETDLRSATWS